MRKLNIENINYDKLLEYGFKKVNNSYLYEKIIYNDFKIVIEISQEKQISKLIDLSVDDEYVLVDVKNTSGKFIGELRDEYENVLNDFIDKCTVSGVFKFKQSIKVINYLKNKYNDELEFLWESSPNTAIVRNKVNNKWYLIMFVLSEEKLGLNSSKIVDVLNVRYPNNIIKEYIDNRNIFGGYHMNKNNWISVRLDGSVNLEEIFKLIDGSYEISLKK